MLLLSICVVVLAACIGECTSISCSMPIAHNTEHDSRHVCTDISHIAMHKDRQGPGGTLVVGVLAVVLGVGVPAVVLGVVLGTGPNVVL